MEALICFVVAMMIFLLLFDQYCHETSQERSQVCATGSDVESRNPPKTNRYYSTSLFATLGLSREEVHSFAAFRDRFRSFAEVSTAMLRAGLPDIHVIVGIDFSASNEWQGRKCFRGESLHAVRGTSIYNPYQKVLSSLGGALTPLLHGNPIPAFGFGDVETKDVDVFPLVDTGAPCLDFNDLLCAYAHVAQRVQPSGPTSYAPVVKKARDIASSSREFHVLLIVTDGRIGAGDTATRRALVAASHHPLSIVLVGVGDGPFSVLEEYDDLLPERQFDNLQLVKHLEATKNCRNPDASLALHALMEIPDQYRAIVKMGLLKGQVS